MDKKMDLNQTEPMYQPYEAQLEQDRDSTPSQDFFYGDDRYGQYPGGYDRYGQYPRYGRYPGFGRYPWFGYQWYRFPWYGYPWYGRRGRGPWWYDSYPRFGSGQSNVDEGELENNEAETDIHTNIIGFPWFGFPYPWYGYPYYPYSYYPYPFRRRRRIFY